MPPSIHVLNWLVEKFYSLWIPSYALKMQSQIAAALVKEFEKMRKQQITFASEVNVN